MRLGTKFLLLFGLIAGAIAVFWFVGLRGPSLPEFKLPTSEEACGGGQRTEEPVAKRRPHFFHDPIGKREAESFAKSADTRPREQTPPAPSPKLGNPPFSSSINEGRLRASELNKAVAGADPPGPTLVPDSLDGVVISEPLAGSTERNIYTVKAGDTLSAIATERLGSPSRWTIIAEANPGIDPNRLSIGQRLVIPAVGETVDAKPAAAQTETKLYEIKKGDTLIGIARRLYGDSSRYMAIWRANRDTLPSPNAILHPGQKLRLPPDEPTP